MIRKNFNCLIGRPCQLAFILKNAVLNPPAPPTQGPPINISGAVGMLIVKQNKTDQDSAALKYVTWTVDQITGVSGFLGYLLQPSDTSGFPVGNNWYGLTVTLPGNQPQEYAEGNLITRSPVRQSYTP